jgi:hypothetical protein
MKKIALIVVALSFGHLADVAAQSTPAYEQTPLPPGPILGKVADFSAWQIVYSYASSGVGPGGSPSSNAGGLSKAPNPHLPKTFTMTHTRSLWHAVLVDISDTKNETWYDGTTRFEQGTASSKLIPISNGGLGGQTLKFYFRNGEEFPDVEWVSPSNYLGTEKGTGYWVFQQGAEGPTLWVNSTTHYPVRWQKDGETRDFQFLPEPTASLTLPPNIVGISKALKHLDDVSHVAPPHL